MPINPNIALGFQQPQMPDPLAQYARVSAIQQAQQQNALAALQTQKAQQDIDTQNALRQVYANPNLKPGSLEAVEAAYRVSPVAGAAMHKDYLAGVKEQRQGNEAQAKADAENLKFWSQSLPLAAMNPTDEVIGALAREGVNRRAIAPEMAQSYVQGLLAMPLEQRKAALTQVNAGLQKLGAGDVLVNPVTNATVAQAPQAKPDKQKLYEQDVAQGYAGTIGQWLKEQANAGATRMAITNQFQQEAEFEKELGKGQASQLLKGKEAADDAASVIRTVQQGRQLLNAGAITGAGADFLVKLNQGLKTAGIDFGYADPAANSQAFAANMAQNVGKIIKQFGSGTGLSDSDRRYAEAMAGGQISLDRKAIDTILDINERQARWVIAQQNKRAEGVKSKLSLTTEIPAEEMPATAKPAATGGVKVVSTEAEYRALPKGAQFRKPDDPEGQYRVKQ